MVPFRKEWPGINLVFFCIEIEIIEYKDKVDMYLFQILNKS